MSQSIKLVQMGTHRVVPIEHTLEKITKHCEGMGITRVANITGLDTLGIPVYMACRPNSRSLAVSQGKGISADAAKVSAIMEAVESYHAERIGLPVKILSLSDLQKINSVIDISLLNKLKDKIFTPYVRIPWIEGKDLFSGLKKWLPYECVHTDYTCPSFYSDGYFIADTNGLASGNSFNEAINHAICEVIERDALAIWSLTPPDQKKRRKINLSTIDMPFIRSAYQRVLEMGANIAIWDITSDIGIPTFICKILQDVNHRQSNIRPAYGSGTHLCKEVAILRALTEAAQSRLTFIAGSRDDQYSNIYVDQVDPARLEKWRLEIEGEGSVDFKNIHTHNNNTTLKDQKFLLASLKKAGVKEAVVVDLTLQEFKIPVVKVLIPGLEGISYSGRRIIGERGKRFFQEEGVGACRVQ